MGGSQDNSHFSITFFNYNNNITNHFGHNIDSEVTGTYSTKFFYSNIFKGNFLICIVKCIHFVSFYNN